MLPSDVDDHLCVLWSHYGHSWRSLEARLRRTPRGGAKLAAARTLRARLASDDTMLAKRSPGTAQVEDALSWLNALTPTRSLARSAQIDRDTRSLDTNTLVARLASASPRMPRREMEEIVRRGVGTARRLMASLRQTPLGNRALWAVVLLGELRDPCAVDLLIELLGAPASTLAETAADALGKIGAPAVSPLAAVIARGSLDQRLYAYGALGLIHTPEAFRRLEEGLTTTPELGDVIARSLAQHARPEARHVIIDGARFAPRWMRPHFAAAIASLATPSAPDPIECDWRLRYRRLPALGWRHPPAWTTLASLAHRQRAAAVGIRSTTNAADLAAHRRLDSSAGRCGVCGGRLWRLTGCPICRHTARAVIALQRSLLDSWTSAGLTDAWKALDACDAADVRLAGLSDNAGAQRTQHAREMNAVGRATLYWTVALGYEHRLTSASTYLDVLANDVDIMYGRSDPQQRACAAQRQCPQNYS